MTVVLYRSTAERNRVDKTDYITQIARIEGTLRQECDISSPVILFEMTPSLAGESIYPVTDSEGNIVNDDEGTRAGTILSNNVLTANYAFIVDFNRWYHITQISSVRQNLWRLTLHCDVLMTYKTQLYLNGGIIARNENDYNAYLDDPMISFQYDLDVTEYEIDSEGDDITVLGETSDNDVNTAVTVIMTDSHFIYGSTNLTRPSPDNVLADVNVENTAHSPVSMTYFCHFNQVESLLADVAVDQTLAGWIVNIIRYPFEIPHADGLTNNIPIGEGDHTATFGGYQPIDSTPMSEFYKIAEINVTPEYLSFRDHEPYTQLELYLPYVGWIDLSTVDCYDSTIAVYYVVDYSSGQSQVFVVNETTDKLLYVNTCQIGVSVPRNTTTAYETNVQRLQNTANLVTGILGGVGKATGGLGEQGNPVSAGVGGGVAIGGSIMNYITSSMTTRVKANAVIPEGQLGLFAPQKCRLRITRRQAVNDDSNFTHLYGRPLNEYRLLGSLTGYTVVSEIHLEGFDSALDNEVSEISTLLRSGVIL